MSDDKDDYEVGYGKPPKHTRWGPGQSGNRRSPIDSEQEVRIAVPAALLERALVDDLNAVPHRLTGKRHAFGKWDISGNFDC